LGSENLEGCIIDEEAHGGLTLFLVGDTFYDLGPGGFQLFKEPAMVLSDDVVELLPEMAGIGGTCAVGANCDLEAASPDDGCTEEVAAPRFIDAVAEDFLFLSIAVDALVDFGVVCGGDDEGGLADVFLRIGAFDKLDTFRQAECLEGCIDMFGDYDEACACFKERQRLALGDETRPHKQHTTARQLKEYWVLGHNLSITRCGHGGKGKAAMGTDWGPAVWLSDYAGIGQERLAYVTGFNIEPYLFAVDGYMLGGIDAEPNLATSDVRDNYLHVITDNKRFIFLPAEHEHGGILSPVKTQFPYIRVKGSEVNILLEPSVSERTGYQYQAGGNWGQSGNPFL
jgi:hypothetical protein